MNVKQFEKAVREAEDEGIDLVRDEDSPLELRRQGGTWKWSVRYRVDGHRPRATLGIWPRTSLAKARVSAAKVLRRVDAGENPAKEKREERRKGRTVEELSSAYIEQYAKVRKKKRGWQSDQSMLRCEVLPKWKHRPVVSIDRGEVQALIAGVAKRGPTFAANVGRLLSKMFSWGLDTGWITVNPATRVIPRQPRNPDGEKQEAYSDEEIRIIWRNTQNLLPIERVPIRLGLLLGQRPGEIAGMQWEEIEGEWWRIPGARTKNGRPHRVPLSPFAQAVLSIVPRVESQPFLFEGRRGPKQLTAVNLIAFKGVREREKPRHALRHTVGTNLAALGVSREDRSKVLNHTDTSVTGIYDEYEYEAEKREALEKWAERLIDILSQPTPETAGGLTKS